MSTNSAPYPGRRGTARWLSEDEEASWRAFRRMLVAITERTAADLVPTGLSVSDYDVLSKIADRDGRPWGLREMAESMEWSRSRLSRQLARMQERGLITRDPDEADGRGIEILMSEAGRAALRSATGAHLASVRRHYIDKLSPRDLDILRRLADHVVGSGDAGSAPD